MTDCVYCLEEIDFEGVKEVALLYGLLSLARYTAAICDRIMCSSWTTDWLWPFPKRTQ